MHRLGIASYEMTITVRWTIWIHISLSVWRRWWTSCSDANYWNQFTLYVYLFMWETRWIVRSRPQKKTKTTIWVERRFIIINGCMQNICSNVSWTGENVVFTELRERRMRSPLMHVFSLRLMLTKALISISFCLLHCTLL